MSLLQRLEKQKEDTNVGGSPFTKSLKTDPWQTLKNKIHNNVIRSLEKLPAGEVTSEMLLPFLQKELNESQETIPRTERERIMQEITDEILGFGPITSLLQDESVSEIMVNGPYQVYVERKGKLELTPITFADNDHVLHIIEKIVAPIGRRIDESSPLVDARLKDGSRVNAIIPPLALNGPTITIRKFAKEPFQVDDLISFGTLTPNMALFLEACVAARLNIVVSGGTGSGKTTTLGILSAYIPQDERIITIEDAAELQLRQNHVISLETRPANVEGKGQITIRDLVINSLRMRPERIIVGEVRGGEALDMLQAMNTGHDGSLTTGHANNPRDMISRLETMVLMAGMNLPLRAIREQISSAVDLIIQQSRMRDGTRRITHITEVLGLEGDIITTQDIFRFEQGVFRPTGIRPMFYDRLISAGQELGAGIFG